MFGYITPLVCELKVREYELFQAYYCGLCKELKREYSKSTVLNYDCTFIYILGDSLHEEHTDIGPCKCILHPVKKKQAVSSEHAGYAAAINILMAYSKAADDVHDRGGPRARLSKHFMVKAGKKAARMLPGVAEKTELMAEKLHRLEAEGSCNTDETADTYAELFGSVLQELAVLQSHILYELGYSLGRWVYLIDAYDDIEKDMANGEYNVFVNKYGITGKVPEDVKKEIEFKFNFTLSQAMQALERLELKKNREILTNIICLGLKKKTQSILEGTMNESLPGSGR